MDFRTWPNRFVQLVRAGAGGRRNVMLALLVALAASLRAAYLFETLELPFIDGPVYDSLVYLRQARAISEGDFGHPALVAFGPLYGWLIAALGGEAHTLRVAVVQMVLGCADVYLVFRIAETVHGSRAGIAAALLFTGYGLVLFYEGKILSETLGLTLLLAGMRLYVSRAFAAGTPGTSIACGAVLGLAALARASLVFVAPLSVAFALLPWGSKLEGGRGRYRLGRAAGVLIGLAAAWGGSGLWNLHHTGIFVPVILVSRTVETTTRTAWTGSLGDHDTDGSGVGAFDVVEDAAARIESGRPGTSLGRVDWAGWILHSPAKIAGTLADTETSFQYGYYGERTEVLSLRLLPVSFGFLALAALAGAFLLWRAGEAATLVPLLPVVLGIVMVTTLYHPSSRYRLPVVLPLCVMSGCAAASVLEMRGRLRPAVWAAVLAAAFSFFAFRTMSYRLRDPALWHLRVAGSAIQAGDVGEANRRLDLALAARPSSPETQRRIDELGRALGRGDR